MHDMHMGTSCVPKVPLTLFLCWDSLKYYRSSLCYPSLALSACASLRLPHKAIYVCSQVPTAPPLSRIPGHPSSSAPSAGAGAQGKPGLRPKAPSVTVVAYCQAKVWLDVMLEYCFWMMQWNVLEVLLCLIV